MFKKTLSLLLTLCLLLTVVPTANADSEHVHTYAELVYAATCKEPEIHVNECTKCYAWDWDTFRYVGEKAPHAYAEFERIEPTCTEPGAILYMCSGCEDIYEVSIEPTGHDQAGPLHFAAATCTEPETKYVDCSKCGTMQIHETTGEPLGHHYVETERKDAACAEVGKVIYTCDRENCGATYTEEFPALGHDYAESARKAATCTEVGEVFYTCGNCGATYTEEFPALGHSYAESEHIDATCTEDGKVIYTCDRENCGASYAEESPALGHSYAESARKAATCAGNGSVTYTCSRCGDAYSEPLRALGHNWTTSDGYTYKCTRCGKTEVDEEARAEAEATPIPDAYGNVNDNGDLTDLTLTSAIKQVGGGYSLRREEATLNSITLAAERDPENSWMRLTASEPARQLGMQSGFIGDNMTLTLTENDQELTITGAKMDGHVLTITTSCGAVFELSTLNVSLGCTELDSIAEKNLDRIIFKRCGSVLMIDFGSKEAMGAAEAAARTVPDDTAAPSPTPTPRPTAKFTITFYRGTLTTATPAPEAVIITTPEPVVFQQDDAVIEIQTESPNIIIYPCESEETVEEYQRSNCLHKWDYEERNCQSPRTCVFCGKHEETPSSHCWYVTNNGGVRSGIADHFLLECHYCKATMEEVSQNQAQCLCAHTVLYESRNILPTSVGTKNETSYWCDTAMQCGDCNRWFPPVGHNWKITGQDGDYYTAECARCGKVTNAHKKFYNEATGKLNMSAVSCADDPNAHQWTVIEADGCKRTLLCANCGTQEEMDHDWQSTKDGCRYTAVCSVCGKTETATIHGCIDRETDYTGKRSQLFGRQAVIKLICTACGETTKSIKFYTRISDLSGLVGSKKYVNKLKELTGGQKLPIYPSNIPFYFSEAYIQNK